MDIRVTCSVQRLSFSRQRFHYRQPCPTSKHRLYSTPLSSTNLTCASPQSHPCEVSIVCPRGDLEFRATKQPQQLPLPLLFSASSVFLRVVISVHEFCTCSFLSSRSSSYFSSILFELLFLFFFFGRRGFKIVTLRFW